MILGTQLLKGHFFVGCLFFILKKFQIPLDITPSKCYLIKAR